MKRETQLLLVILVLLLSIGPLSFFFEKPKEIPAQQNQTEQQQPTTYKFSGNLTGEIVSLGPYISFAGVASSLNESYVRARIASIPQISNYTLGISLNPKGDGYMYSITVPSNDSATAVGFRLYYQLGDFFDRGSMVPVRQGLVKLLPSISVYAGNRSLNITTEGEKVSALLMYSQEPNRTIKIYCPEYDTTRGYKFLVARDCYDSTQAYYYGLAYTDRLPVISKFLQLNATVVKLENKSYFEGKFPFGRKNKTELESALNNISGVANATVEMSNPANEMDVGGVFTGNGTFNESAYLQALYGIKGVENAYLAGNRTIAGSVYFSENASASEIATAVNATLGLANFTYKLPGGNYKVTLLFNNQSANAGVYRELVKYGLDVAKSHGFGWIGLPSSVTLNGQDYELFKVSEARVETNIETKQGDVARVQLEFSVLYDEVLDYPPVSGYELP